MHFTYSIIMTLGLAIGHGLRCEHTLNPFPKDSREAFVVFSLLGLVITPYLKLFVFLNMITLGWNIWTIIRHIFI
jgi:hypothetical protein